MEDSHKGTVSISEIRMKNLPVLFLHWDHFLLVPMLLYYNVQSPGGKSLLPPVYQYSSCLYLAQDKPQDSPCEEPSHLSWEDLSQAQDPFFALHHEWPGQVGPYFSNRDFKTEVHTQGMFPISALLTCEVDHSLLWDDPVLCRMFSSIPDLHPLDAISSHHSYDKQICLQRILVTS